MKFQCHSCSCVVEIDSMDEFVCCGSCNAVCEVPTDFGPRVVIDDFVIEKVLGEGGMGCVYLAHQFSLDRKIALKVLKDKYNRDIKFKEEFVKESRSVASLNHPKIIQAYKVGEEDGTLFFAMEYVNGKNLKDILREEGTIDQLRVLEIAQDVVEALEYAWDRQKLVHRDIKPENIMVTNEGVCKLMDLGLSLRGDDNLNDEGDQISGTPQYISPEQVAGQEVDIRTDFYCLGATLYHLLCGEFPFQGTIQEIVKGHLSEKAVPVRKRNPDVDAFVSKMVSRLMSKYPEDRFQTAKELLKEIKSIKRSLGESKTRKGHNTKFSLKTDKNLPVYNKGRKTKRKKKSSNPLVPMIGGIAVLLVLGILAILVMGSKNQSANSGSKAPIITMKDDQSKPVEMDQKAEAPKIATQKPDIAERRLFFEAESLNANSNKKVTTHEEKAASGKKWQMIEAEKVGDYIEYAIRIPNSGTYSFDALYKQYGTKRGITQFYINGKKAGNEINQQMPIKGDKKFVKKNLGKVQLIKGINKLKIVCTGTTGKKFSFTLDAVEFNFVE